MTKLFFVGMFLAIPPWVSIFASRGHKVQLLCLCIQAVGLICLLVNLYRILR